MREFILAVYALARSLRPWYAQLSLATRAAAWSSHSAHTSRGRGTRTEAPKVPRGVDIRGKPGRPEALPTPPCHQAWWSNPEPNSELSVLPRSFWDQADTRPRSVSGEGERLRFYADLEPGGVPDCCDVRWCSTQTLVRCHSGRRGGPRCSREPSLAFAKPTLAHRRTCLGTSAPQKE